MMVGENELISQQQRMFKERVEGLTSRDTGMYMQWDRNTGGDCKGGKLGYRSSLQ